MDKAQYLLSARALLGRLTAALESVQAQQRTNAAALGAAQTGASDTYKKRSETLLSNLEPRTIALLKRDAAGFVTKQIEHDIEEARNPSIGFWTWLFRDPKKEKATKVAASIAALQQVLAKWLASNSPTPAAAPKTATLITQRDELKARAERLSARIARVRQSIDIYSQAGAPDVPSNVSASVTSFDRSARQDPSALWHENDFGFESSLAAILQQQAIQDEFEAARRRREEEALEEQAEENRRARHRRHADDDDDSSVTTGPWDPSRDRDTFRGSGRHEPESRVRVDVQDAAPARESRVRIDAEDAAPAHEARVSLNAEDAAPVIANPFGEGRASIDASGPSYGDRSESGSGTRY